MKIFWSWQSDTPGGIGRYLVRDALKGAIDKLKQVEEIEDATRENLHLDQDIQGVTGTPDLAATILGKIAKSEVVIADVTVVGKSEDGEPLINSNVAIELGYALHACTDERVLLVFNRHYGNYQDLPFDLRHKGGAIVFDIAPGAGRKEIEIQHNGLLNDFVRKLTPFLQQAVPSKEQLSVRAIIDYRLLQRWPMPGGGTDDLFQLLVSIENDGEQAASDFKLQVDVPAEFLDGAPPFGLSRPSPPGFSRFELTNENVPPPALKILYP